MKFTVIKCKTKAGWITKPTKPIRLKLENIKTLAKPSLQTNQCAVVTIDGISLVIHSYGEIQFKQTINKETALNLSEKIYAILL